MPVPESNRRAIKKYDAEHYTVISARIPKELARAFREKTASKGDSQAAIFKAAIEAYLAK